MTKINCTRDNLPLDSAFLSVNAFAAEDVMANPEHVAKLKEGVEAWNRWRWKEAGPENPDLSQADLQEFRLSGVDLSDANLFGANLIQAHLQEAFLRSAILSPALLSSASLRSASMRLAFSSSASRRSAVERLARTNPWLAGAISIVATAIASSSTTLQNTPHGSTRWSCFSAFYKGNACETPASAQ